MQRTSQQDLSTKLAAAASAEPRAGETRWRGVCPPAGAGYGAAVLIAVLLFSEATVAKLAAHAITPEEVSQVDDGDRVVTANHGRAGRDRC